MGDLLAGCVATLQNTTFEKAAEIRSSIREIESFVESPEAVHKFIDGKPLSHEELVRRQNDLVLTTPQRQFAALLLKHEADIRNFNSFELKREVITESDLVEFGNAVKGLKETLNRYATAQKGNPSPPDLPAGALKYGERRAWQVLDDVAIIRAQVPGPSLGDRNLELPPPPPPEPVSPYGDGMGVPVPVFPPRPKSI